MGNTQTALNDEGARVCFVLVISGYANLITDHHNPTAVETAWAATNWTSAIAGLSVDGTFEQSFEPWSNKVQVSTLRFLINDADGEDTFGTDIWTSKPSINTALTATYDATTGAGTINVKDSSGISASDIVYVGNERFVVNSVAAGQVTHAAAGSGVLAAFTANGGTTNPWQHSRPSHQSWDVAADPRLTDVPKQWTGRYVGLYIHRIVDGVLDTKAEASLLWAGTIASIQDSPSGATILECQDVRAKLRDVTLLRDQFKGRVREGCFLAAGTKFWASDAVGNTGVSTSTDLDVVSSGASGTTQINEGWYSAPEMANFLNEWIQAETMEADAMSFAIVNDGGSRLQMVADYSGLSANGIWCIMRLHTNVHRYLVFLGFGDGQVAPSEDKGWHVEHGYTIATSGALVLNSKEVPYRVMASQSSVRSILGRWAHWPAPVPAQLELDDTEGTWFEHASLLPTPLSEWADGTDASLMISGDAVFFAEHDSDTSFTLINTKDPFSQLASGNESIPNKTMDEDGDVEVRQFVVLSGTVTDIMSRLLASVNGDGVNHATYDDFPAGSGAGIPWELLGDNFINTCNALQEASESDSMIVPMHKPTALVDIITAESTLRFAWLIFKDGGLQWVSPQIPNASTADWTLDETNKAGPAGESVDLKATTEITSKWLRNVLKIKYGYTPDGKSHDTLTIKDATSIGDFGEMKPITIKARHVYRDDVRAGDAIEAKAGRLATAIMPMFGRPVRVYKRSINGSLYNMAPGDMVALSDDFIRDPTTGQRGLAARPCTVLSVRHSGYNPKGLWGEVVLLFSDEERTFPYAASAEVDETYTSGAFTAGWDSASKKIRLKSHAHSHASADKDILSYTSGDPVRISEIDPSDPSAADTFTDVLSAVGADDVTLTTGFGAGGNPAHSSSKYYHLGFDDYSTVQTAQKLTAFLADEADGELQGVIPPNTYGDAPPPPVVIAFATNDATTLPELHSDEMYAEGEPLGPNIVRHVSVAANSLINYRTAPSMPVFLGTNIATFNTDVDYVFLVMPFPIGRGTFPAGRTRKLYIRTRMSTGNVATTANCSVTSTRSPPVHLVAAAPIAPYNQVTFTSTSTTFEVSSEQALTIVPSDIPGVTWISVRVWRTGASNVVTLADLPQFHLGPLEQV